MWRDAKGFQQWAGRAQFMLADGRIIENEIGQMWLRLGDKAESEPLLGAYALEGMALAVDSLNERLVPMPWLLLGAELASA